MPAKRLLAPPPARPAPGRPRSPQARRAVLDAARALIEEQGFAAATIEAISARAGVAKTTVYRSWPNRATLLVDLLVEVATEAVPPPANDAGDPMRTLRTELRRGAVALNGLTGRLLTSLLGEAQEDPEVRTALLEGFFYRRREASVAVVRRAQALGQIRSDVSASLVTDLLYGPLFYRTFVVQDPVSEGVVKQMIQYVLDGLRPQDTRHK